MSQESTQVRATQSEALRQTGTFTDRAKRQWHAIRQKIVSLVQGGIDALLFAVDRGAETDGEEARRKRVQEALREHFGESPAELLLQTPPEEREVLVAQFHTVIAQGLGIEASTVGSADLANNSGLYSWEYDLFLINADELLKQPLTLTEAKELLDTILHETYHSFQRKATVRPSRYGVQKSEAQTWRINFKDKNYIKPEQNPERYWTQPVEVTARIFAAQVLKGIYA